MTFPLWLQIAAGIITAEIVILGMKGIKNWIGDRDTDFYCSHPSGVVLEYQNQTREIIKIGVFGLVFIIVYLVVCIRIINSL